MDPVACDLTAAVTSNPNDLLAVAVVYHPNRSKPDRVTYSQNADPKRSGAVAQEMVRDFARTVRDEAGTKVRLPRQIILAAFRRPNGPATPILCRYIQGGEVIFLPEIDFNVHAHLFDVLDIFAKSLDSLKGGAA